MTENSAEKVVVTIDDAHLGNIQSIASDLKSAGMTINNILATSGIITGEVIATKMKALHGVVGVVDVEIDGDMHML